MNAGLSAPDDLDSVPVPTTPAVQVTDLVKKYDGVTVVDSLSLTAAAGSVTAVLGPNGAGKTTTIECCEGLRVPDGGQVRVLGLDPRTDAAALRPRVGVMLQDSGLPAQKRAGEVLRHVSRMHRTPWDTADLDDRLGLDAFATTTVRRLSGGQRQRLALACALVGRPEVVFLDEPSAGMDPQSRLAVWDLVRSLRDVGTSIILTTHLMDEAAELADDVVVVDHGRVIAQGAPDQLTAGAGDQVATFRLESAVPADALPRLRETLTQRGGTWTVEASVPSRLRVTGPLDPAALAAVTTWCAEQDLLVAQFDLGRRTLEDFFLELTGRSMR